MNILITGGNGYIARQLKAQLSPYHNITSVTRNNFDLTNHKETSNWLAYKHFDVVIHTAISGGSRLNKDSAVVLDNNLKMYYNLLDNSKSFVKLISIGSGAELYAADTPYGLSKHVIRQSILDKDNFYNLRIFAVFDEHELDTRFIKANITNYINRNPIVIHQNKYMDFFYMEDFAKVVRFYIENSNVPKEFDCTYNRSHDLKGIADKINTLSDYSVDIQCEVDGLNKNYTGTYTPLPIDYIGLDAGIQTVYEKLVCKI